MDFILIKILRRKPVKYLSNKYLQAAKWHVLMRQIEKTKGYQICCHKAHDVIYYDHEAISVEN